MKVSIGMREIMILALLKVGDESRMYGMGLIAQMREITGEAISKGAMYEALYRLERKGWVFTTKEERSSPMRGGRAKILYGVTKEGLEQYRRQRESLRRVLSLDKTP